MPTDPDPMPLIPGQELTQNWPEQAVAPPAQDPPGEQVGELTIIDDPPGEPTTFRGIAHYLLEGLRSGAMWAGWTEEGRPAFGDDSDAIPPGVTVEHAAEELAILAGVMALDTVQRAAATRPPGSAPSGMNRAERRAAEKANRRRRV